ncbi:hypothetical protein ACFXDF_02760 [Streptomyces sp. NPDC059426]
MFNDMYQEGRRLDPATLAVTPAPPPRRRPPPPRPLGLQMGSRGELS